MSAPAPAPGPDPAPSFGDTNFNATVTALTSGPYTDLNTSFLLSSGYLVFFMHCGFAMISVGCVRARFAKHIAILILIDACASAMGFYLFGYAFAFGDPVDADGKTAGNAFIGYTNFAMSGLPISQFGLWFFEWAFAATACTIVSGAIAERARAEAYILYSFFMAAWVYPVIVHSIWSGSGVFSMFRNSPHYPTFLFGSGAIDFAGSGAVHMVGGYAAATGCWVLGPRIGRYLQDGTCVEMPGHNTSLFVLGVMILWFGWYGFNPGSQLVVVNYSSAVALAATTTTLAPAAAGLSALIVKAIATKISTGVAVYDVGVMGNGALAGLVAITSGTSTIWPWGAIIVGFVAGAIYVGASRVSILLHLDDPLDAIAVHAWNGTWGVIAVGFFAGKEPILNSYGPNPYEADVNAADYYRPWGCFLGGGGKLLAAQICYALWIAGWVVGNMLPFFFLLKVCGLFRVSANAETMGLDDSYHGGSAYPGGPEEVSDKSLKSGMNGTSGVSKADIDSLKAEIASLKASVGKV